MASSRAGASLPRVAQTVGGMVLETGWQNRGVSNAIARHGKLWPKIGLSRCGAIGGCRCAQHGQIGGAHGECPRHCGA